MCVIRHLLISTSPELQQVISRKYVLSYVTSRYKRQEKKKKGQECMYELTACSKPYTVFLFSNK